MPKLKPGDRYKVIGWDGTEFEDTVHSVHVRFRQPEVREQPTGWRRVLRAMTPPRWRKPLPVIQEAQPTTFEVIGASEVGRRAAANVERAHAAAVKLLEESPEL